MPDPVTTVAASSPPAAAAAGASAMALAILGVDVQSLALGLVGSVLGLSFAKPASVVHAASRFVASSIFSAVAGSAAAETLAWTALGRGAAICGAGIVLHLWLSWLSRRFDNLADAGAAKVGITIDQGSKL